jgi:hypothetical protein
MGIHTRMPVPDFHHHHISVQPPHHPGIHSPQSRQERKVWKKLIVDGLEKDRNRESRE